MKPSLLDRRNRNFVPLLVLLILLLQGVTALCLLGQWLALHRLAKKDLAFVQTHSGETFSARAVDATTHQPETIRRFVSKTMYLLFNWSGEISGAEGQRTPDPGQEIEIGGTKVKVPTAVLYASYALAQDLQKPLLKKIAGIVPPGAFNGTTQAVLVLERVSAPKEIAPADGRCASSASTRLYEATCFLASPSPLPNGC